MNSATLGAFTQQFVSYAGVPARVDGACSTGEGNPEKRPAPSGLVACPADNPLVRRVVRRYRGESRTVARRRVYNLPFDVLECDGCGERSPLDIPPGELHDWLVVATDDGEVVHLCPDCHGAVTPPRRFEKRPTTPPVERRRF